MKLPQDFRSMLQGQVGFDLQRFIESFDLPVSTSIRTNPLKPSNDYSSLEKVPWCVNGYYLPERPNFSHDPLWHAGAYYVQESSSMFLDEILRQIQFQPSKKMLDLCAAPGGKSTILASYLQQDDILISNEVISSRVNILIENIVKWGYSNVIITQNQAIDFQVLNGFFDLVVVDAPCSGEGLFRKMPEAMNLWSLDNVQQCEIRQMQILNDIHPSVAVGGYLIYSTCTYNERENILNLEKFAQKYGYESVTINVSAFPQITEIDKNGVKGYAFYPYKVKGEGFFCGILKKLPSDTSQFHASSADFKSKPLKMAPTPPQEFFNPEKHLNFVEGGEDIFAMTDVVLSTYLEVKNHLRVRNAGVKAGAFKGKDFIPSHAMAMSCLMNQNYDSVELSLEDALYYLRKNSIKSQAGRHGYVLAQHQNVNLGWMKNVGNRYNNLYPMEYRLRN